MIKPVLLIVLFLSGVWPSGSLKAQDHYDPDSLYSKDEITIVITDSGLGGLSVMDDIAGKMKNSGCFRQVNLIFVNALFNENTGYNTLQTKKEKTDVLNNVLTAIDENYHPDAILIACNTLSVIYDETDFFRRSETPVIGIVGAGVELISEKLNADTTGRVIIFGTETTIEENSHRESLMKLNFSGERIFTMACPQLQSYIEQNPESEETEMLISFYVNEALDKIEENANKVYISLNCSHFGYSEKLWTKAIENTPYHSGGILNPNYIMGNFLTDEKYHKRYSDTKISFLVVSKIKLLNVDPISGIFLETSPELADAIRNYTLIPELF